MHAFFKKEITRIKVVFKKEKTRTKVFLKKKIIGYNSLLFFGKEGQTSVNVVSRLPDFQHLSGCACPVGDCFICTEVERNMLNTVFFEENAALAVPGCP